MRAGAHTGHDATCGWGRHIGVAESHRLHAPYVDLWDVASKGGLYTFRISQTG